MEPTPETAEALAELGAMQPNEDLLEQLLLAGRRVEEVVPDVVGMSLTTVEHGVTFTLVASDETIAILDALQYQGRVCAPWRATLRSPWIMRRWVRRAGTSSPTSPPPREWPALSRCRSWRAARSSAASTSTVGRAGPSRGTTSSWQTSWVPGPGERSRTPTCPSAPRTVAEQAPAVLRDARKLDVAHGLLAEALGFTVDEARQRLRQAAVRAELHPVRLAEVLTSLLDAPEN